MTPAQNNPLVCIMGPTAVGKTALAIQLAAKIGGELISCDSALVYRGLSIGAAQSDYPHHLVDIRDPSEIYNVANFVQDARAKISDIASRGQIPILVGGSMLYFHGLLIGLNRIPAADPSIRQQIEREALAEGWPSMHAELARVDPESANRLHRNHSHRIGRALEVFRSSGIPLSRWQKDKRASYDQPFRCIGLMPSSRHELHVQIERRFDQMMSDGFLEEVRALYNRGDLSTELPAIRAAGYRQLWAHLSGEHDLNEARMAALAATRQIAKRQISWMRGWPRLEISTIDLDQSKSFLGGSADSLAERLSGTISRNGTRSTLCIE